MSVLYVDDDEQICDFLSTFSNILQLEHETAVSAMDALEKCEKIDDVQIIVTDLVMPEIDGVTFAKIVREKYPDKQIFAFTAHDGKYSHGDLVNVFDKVFSKPSDYSRMVAEVMKSMAINKYPGLGL